MSALRIEPLDRRHDLDPFDCGREALNLYLRRHGLANHAAGAGRTYVALSGKEVVGYHTLAAAQVDYAGAPGRLTKGMARHPIPLMLLARLAVTRQWQGRGLGAGLLKDAMLRTLAAAEIAGVRALAVHAKDEEARRFYERFDFIPSPSDPDHLFLLVKEIRATVR